MSQSPPEASGASIDLEARRVQSGRAGETRFLNDLQVACVDCGDTFSFTVAEQRFYAERGIRQPVRCGSCRALRRAERNATLISGYESVRESSSWVEVSNGSSYGLVAGGSHRPPRGPRVAYHATCAACGKDTEVPFQPRSGRPVYCRECYAARRGR
ncbi:MAG: zinc-ribbon domain containing protein [Thermomicrobiales bacterium]|nr:zinc-ribbon domain containing protein [Thermomicrobiales bacterium]